jgi:hemolysin III
MDHAVSHIAAQNVRAPEFSIPIPKKKPRAKRDPYDGLRPWSAITHGVGAVLSAIGTVFLLLRAAGLNNKIAMLAFAIYGVSMIGLYTASTLYHCINTTVRGRLALRKLDHSSIYLLIAGSYAPVCLVVLNNTAGRVLCAVVWTVAVIGIIMSIAWIDCPRWLTSGMYLFMGWLALGAIGPIVKALPAAGMAALVLGGVLYSVGGVLYAVKWPGRNNPRFGCHEIFHVFILLGSACHFWMMYEVLARPVL